MHKTIPIGTHVLLDCMSSRINDRLEVEYRPGIIIGSAIVDGYTLYNIRLDDEEGEPCPELYDVGEFVISEITDTVVVTGNTYAECREKVESMTQEYRIVLRSNSARNKYARRLPIVLDRYNRTKNDYRNALYWASQSRLNGDVKDYHDDIYCVEYLRSEAIKLYTQYRNICNKLKEE